MAAQQCPHCNQFKFEEQLSGSTMGCGLIIFGVLLPFLMAGGAEYFGGTTNMGVSGIIAIIVIVVGLIMFFGGIFSPSKTVKYKCTNCGFEQEYNKT